MDTIVTESRKPTGQDLKTLAYGAASATSDLASL
jgi:hypothetical protein